MRSGSNGRGVMFILTLGVVSHSLVQALSIPIIGEIAAEFDSSLTAGTWTLTAYLIAAAVATPLIGKIGDQVGKAKMFAFSLLLLAVGCFLAAIAPTIEIFILARAIQGAGGGVMPLSFGLVRDYFEPATVARRVGSLNALIAVGMASGMVLGGPLLDLLNLHWLFLIPGLVALGAAFATIRLPRNEVSHSTGRMSLWSVSTLAAWLVTLLIAITWAPDRGWSNPLILLLFLASAILIWAWVRSELRASVPVMDMKIMSRADVFLGNALALLAGSVAFGTFAFIPQWVQQPEPVGFGASITLSGIMILPAAVFTFISGQFVVPIAWRYSPPVAVIVGAVVAGLGIAQMLIWHEQPWTPFVATGCIGLGMGTIFACVSALVVTMVPGEQTGVVAGMNANVRMIGGALGTAVLTSIVVANYHPESGLPSYAGFFWAFMVLIGVLIVACIAGVLLKRSLPPWASPVS